MFNYLQKKFNENPVPFFIISVILIGLVEGI